MQKILAKNFIPSKYLPILFKNELLAVLSMMVGSNISQDQLVSIAQRTISEADTDKVLVRVMDLIVVSKDGNPNAYLNPFWINPKSASV